MQCRRRWKKRTKTKTKTRTTKTTTTTVEQRVVRSYNNNTRQAVCIFGIGIGADIGTGIWHLHLPEPSWGSNTGLQPSFSLVSQSKNKEQSKGEQSKGEQTNKQTKKKQRHHFSPSLCCTVCRCRNKTGNSKRNGTDFRSVAMTSAYSSVSTLTSSMPTSSTLPPS